MKDGAPLIELVRAEMCHLPGYVAALERGWNADSSRGLTAVREELAEIEADASRFVGRQFDREAKGPPITLPDGTKVPRLPGYRLWIWDGEFCGIVDLRWQPGTMALPDYTMGHLGYAVVPWKRGRGYAKAALGIMLGHARAEGLEYVELTTDPENEASQKVIAAHGGVLHERFTKPPQYGGKPGLRFRIPLA